MTAREAVQLFRLVPGLRWLIRRGSGILFGFPDDADAVEARLDS